MDHSSEPGAWGHGKHSSKGISRPQQGLQRGFAALPLVAISILEPAVSWQTVSLLVMLASGIALLIASSELHLYMTNRTTPE